MNPMRRELLNGLFVLVIASLLSAAFAAFQVELNLQLWVWIVIGVAVVLGFYVVFDLTLRYIASSEIREREWLQRVGTPVRFELQAGTFELGTAGAVIEGVRAMRPGSDLTFLPGLAQKVATKQY